MKIGFLINPIAGMGGKVALKGTDGLFKESLALGAVPISPERAKEFFTFLKKILTEKLEDLCFLVPKGIMGEEIIKDFDFIYEITTDTIHQPYTTREDTLNAVKTFVKEKVDLIIFVGGDGTSLDVYNSLTEKIPILGIPSGVKTYSSVFTHSPEEGAFVVGEFMKNRRTREAEILDLDENAYRKGELRIEIKGNTLVPANRNYFQLAKEASESTETEIDALKRITEELIERVDAFDDETLVIIGSGSSFNLLAEYYSFNRSILGIDCLLYKKKGICKIILNDAREDQIFDLVNEFLNIKILVTPIGGLGFLFGRGNHQLSSRILKKVTKENIIVVATQIKLQNIQNGVLRIYTGDKDVDNMLKGYIKVLTDYGEYKMIKII